MRIFKLFILLLAFVPLGLNAQIQVRLHHPPPNQLLIEHLWWVDLDNTTLETYTVYLHAEVTKAQKGLIFRANSNTFSLPPGKKRIRPKDITDVKDVWYHFKYKDFIIKTGSVPEGNYTACIYVIDTKTNQEIGEHCIHLIVRLPGPPRLISPRDVATLKEKIPLFTWTKPAPLPKGEQVTYTLRIVEVLKGQTKEEAIRSNKPWYEGKALSRPYFLYPTSAKAFDKGKEYAWQIFAMSGGFEIGVSEVWKFETVTSIPAVPLLPSIIVISPNGGEIWAPGNIQTIIWAFHGITAEEIIGDIHIKLLKGGSFYSDISLDAPPGTGDSGSYNWEMPLFQAYGEDYRVEVIANRALEVDPFFREMFDESDTTFTIKSAGKIAFVSCEHDELTNFDIYVIDETGQRRLTSDPWNDNSPAWSPSWAKIAFSSNRDGGDFDIYVMNADGTNQRRLTDHSADDDDPTWSPDGAKIAFTSNRDSNGEIYVMNADGTNLRRLTNHPEHDHDPSWSPDGTEIAFSSNRDGNGEVYVMNSNGTNLRRLTNYPGFDIEPAWSPDGAKIAFTSKRDGDFNIYVMNADGTTQRRLTNHPGEDKHPTWSPDGTKIAFYSKRTGYYDIYVMNADGSRQINLTDSPVIPDWEPVWSPGGFLRLDRRIIDFPVFPPGDPRH